MKQRIVLTLAVFCALCVTAAGLLAIPGPVPDPKYTILHNLQDQPLEGSGSTCQQMATDGSKLYGMTTTGGANNRGSIFSTNIDGTGYAQLFSFSGPDGADPQGAPVLSGTKLYGVTTFGGTTNGGVIWSMNTDGTGFSLVYDFGLDPADPAFPVGTPILDNGRIYCMAQQNPQWPVSYKGAIFSVKTDGTGFQLLHGFTGGVDDGQYPMGSLTLSGTKFYGMASEGGDSNRGVVFSMNKDGSAYTVIHEFAGGVNDGNNPYSSVLVSGSKLYGMTPTGGDSDLGVVFSMNTDGTGFTLMHEFAGGVNDGSSPYGGLALRNGKLYGTTQFGGDADSGVLFSIATDGTGFALVHEFVSVAGSDGFWPNAETPILSGSYLYGITQAGGNAGAGVIWRYEVGAVIPPAPVVPKCFINTLM
ncbi:MAG: hypothetical protein HZB23_00960 [Deltaproteobacteria bacterium]|nr:hypothetical protein [Deltaproteobacteria bacterium]